MLGRGETTLTLEVVVCHVTAHCYFSGCFW